MRIEHQNIFFTSDFHVGHSNVIKHDGRPFKDVNEMNQTLIDNWNSVVSDEDIVFYLGDFAYRCHPKTMKWFVSQLKGKIYFIMGNHDKHRDIASLQRFERIFGDSTGLGGATIQVKDVPIHVLKVDSRKIHLNSFSSFIFLSSFTLEQNE